MSTEKIHPPKPGFKPEEYKIEGKEKADFVDPEGNRIPQTDPDPFEPTDIRSQCGVMNESQHVEQYDGTLGITKAFLTAHQAPVGQLQWNNNLAAIYTNPGNVNGARWCSGTLIARDLFLSAGHCFDSNPSGWVVPRINGTNNPIPPADVARNMHVNFNFQRDPAGNLRPEQQFAVTQLMEHRLGGLDFAIVRLAGNPGDVFGITSVSGRDAIVGEMSAIIGHPAGLPKQIEAGPITGVQASQIRYNDTDTLGGNSGSGVLLSADGTIAGVHTNGGCSGTNPETGFNVGQRMGALQAVSPILGSLGSRRVNAALYSGPKCYFFSGNRYIRVTRGDTGPGTVDAGYPQNISNWGWGTFGQNGIDAALNSGPKCYFFSGNRYIRVTRGDTGPGTVDAGYPQNISNWGWGSFGQSGIDAALYSGPKCYFFSGNRYIRVTRGDTGPGTVDAGYPKNISNWGWGTFGQNGIDAALYSRTKCYFFSRNQYIRVTRGDTGPGAVDAGYPQNISVWGWPASFLI